MLYLCRNLDVQDVEGRTLVGQALTYDRSYTVTDDGGRTWYQEGWRPGSLARSIAACRNSFELRAGHLDSRLGLVRFEDSPEALSYRATLDDSEQGEEALAEATRGNLRAVSLGFHPERQELRNTRTDPIWRTRASIRELSLSKAGQYPDARVMAIRSGPDRIAMINELLDKGQAVLLQTMDVGP